jgi:hypothetical protein
MLIINESSICVILQSALLQLYPNYYDMHIIYFPVLTNHKCTHPCYFSLLLKTCCSEDGGGVEFFDEEF